MNKIINNSFFSIILPTYNREKLIIKAINSVVNQTYSNWELIIIDDGSTDNTKEIIAKKQTEDSRIIYIYQENSDRSTARNNGIKNALGKYICFLDSDDIYEKNHLSILYTEILKMGCPIAMFFCNVSRLQDGVKKKVPFESINNYNNYIEYILLAKETVIPSRVCIHASILKKYTFNVKLNISEDAELFARILVKHELYQIQNYGCLLYTSPSPRD